MYILLPHSRLSWPANCRTTVYTEYILVSLPVSVVAVVTAAMELIHVVVVLGSSVVVATETVIAQLSLN